MVAESVHDFLARRQTLDAGVSSHRPLDLFG
jgi:hypothetical protein